MPIHEVPTAASLRIIIDDVLSDDADFESFCFDRFEAVHRRFTLGMQHQQKVSLLLQHAHRREILEFLCLRFPGRATEEGWYEKVEWEPVDLKIVPLLRRRKRKRLRDIFLGAALSDWLRRLWEGLTPEWRTIIFGAIVMLLSGYGLASLTSLPSAFSVQNLPGSRWQRGPQFPKVPVVPIPEYRMWPPVPDGGQPWTPQRRLTEDELRLLVPQDSQANFNLR